MHKAFPQGLSEPEQLPVLRASPVPWMGHSQSQAGSSAVDVAQQEQTVSFPPHAGNGQRLLSCFSSGKETDPELPPPIVNRASMD